MNDPLKADKNGLKQKMREFKRQGLLSYRAYLEKQLADYQGNKNRKSYSKYIENQLKMNAEKLEKLDLKLTSSDRVQETEK